MMSLTLKEDWILIANIVALTLMLSGGLVLADMIVDGGEHSTGVAASISGSRG